MLRRSTDKAEDNKLAARDASLRYVRDDQPGLTRRRAGRGFRYLTATGRAVRDRATLDRIEALVIPPAWTEVWICAQPHGHIQATGRDARGRKQYLYHERWRAVRDESKYERMTLFAAVLPKLRRRVQRDLAQHGMSRDKVLASVVRLLETTFIRVGNEEYAKTNGSYGLTTLRNHHATVSGETVKFHFRGKSGRVHTLSVTDRRVARVVKRCQDLPGHELLEYLDDEGHPQPVRSEDVNDYLKTVTGGDFTAKDFRTWGGTLLAVRNLRACKEPPKTLSATQLKKTITEAVRNVADELGNTMAVCRKCYIHPCVIEAFSDGTLRRRLRAVAHTKPAKGGLRAEEAALLRLIAAATKAAKPRKAG